MSAALSNSTQYAVCFWSKADVQLVPMIAFDRLGRGPIWPKACFPFFDDKPKRRLPALIGFYFANAAPAITAAITRQRVTFNIQLPATDRAVFHKSSESTDLDHCPLLRPKRSVEIGGDQDR